MAIGILEIPIYLRNSIMLKFVVGLILLMSLPAVSVAEEPAAAAEAAPPAAAAPEAPPAVPEAPVASPEVVKPAAVAPTAAPTPAALPPGFQPWKSNK